MLLDQANRVAWFTEYGTDGSVGVNPAHVATLRVGEISDWVARAGPFFVASGSGGATTTDRETS